MSHEFYKKLLKWAVEAACEASQDSGSHTQSVQEPYLLNEQWVHSYVGIAINDHLRRVYKKPKEYFVTFETCVSWIEDFFGEERGRGRKRGRLRDRQRFDVVVWSEGGQISGLIEIKDQPIMQKYSQISDPVKLIGALRRWPKLKWAIFLFSVRTTKVMGTAGVASALAGKSKFVFDAIEGVVPEWTTSTYPRRVSGKGSQVMWCGVLFERTKVAS